MLLQGELEVVTPYLSDVVCSAYLNTLALRDLSIDHALDWYLSNVNALDDGVLLLVTRAGTIAGVDRDLALGQGL